MEGGLERPNAGSYGDLAVLTILAICCGGLSLLGR